jgi:large subunit ribosomal protein L21
MYALVDIRGKQYKAEKGTVLKVDRLQNEKGDKIEFGEVLMVSDAKGVEIGQPFVKGTKVKATVEDHILDKKVTVYKYKKRKGYRKKQGHRQAYTLIRVDDILTKG